MVERVRARPIAGARSNGQDLNGALALSWVWIGRSCRLAARPMSRNRRRHKTFTGREPSLKSSVTEEFCAQGSTGDRRSGPRPGALALLIDPRAADPSGTRRGQCRSTLRIKSRDDGVTIECRCDHFSLSFHSIAVARKGRFRCLICGLEEAIAGLIDADGRPRRTGAGIAGRSPLR